MKKKILGILIMSVVIFSGCSDKTASDKAKKDAANAEVKAFTTEVKPIKPGTVPQLSTKQKAEVNSKVSSAIQNVDDALKSMDTPNDVNID